MAGDTKDAGPDIVVDDPFGNLVERLESVGEALDRIADAVAGDGAEILAFPTPSPGNDTAIQSQYPRLRVRTLLITVDAPGEVIALRVGSTRYQFNVAIGVSVIPFPIVIERGTDIRFSLVNGVATSSHFYIIGKPE